jgi:undecaprenyl-diphosphatase
MSVLDSVLIGLVQGLTEWLPISSTGQGMLVLIRLININPEQAFAIIIWMHIGTLAAVCYKFRQKLFDLIKVFPGVISKIAKKNRELSSTETVCQFLIYSTFFSFLIAIPIYLVLKEIFPVMGGEIATFLIGLFLIITGLILKKSKKEIALKNQKKISPSDSILAGIVQGFSILPGISRSGIVLTALLSRKIRQEDALELCFLMAVPVMFFGFVGAIIFQELQVNFPLRYLIIGNVVSFLSGLLVLDLFLKLAQKINFGNFCIFIGILSLIPFLIAWI